MQPQLRVKIVRKRHHLVLQFTDHTVFQIERRFEAVNPVTSQRNGVHHAVFSRNIFRIEDKNFDSAKQIDKAPQIADLHIDLDQTTGYLRWTPTASRNGEPAVRYNVYAATSFPVETNRPENLVRTGLQNPEFAFNPIVYYTQGYHFAVTSIDCYGQESEAAQLSLPKSQPVTSGLKLKQNGKLLDLPEWDTDFLVFCDISDRILFTAPYARQLDISLIQRGFYRIKTLESNGQSRLIGYFFKQ